MQSIKKEYADPSLLYSQSFSVKVPRSAGSGPDIAGEINHTNTTIMNPIQDLKLFSDGLACLISGHSQRPSLMVLTER